MAVDVRSYMALRIAPRCARERCRRTRPGHRRLRHTPSGHRLGAHVFTAAIAGHGEPEEVVTDRAAALANVIEELVPRALHNTTKYANNRVECDHGRLKARRLRPMRGLKTDRTATAIIAGHSLIQNLRRDHYGLGVDTRADNLRRAAAFDEPASMI